MERRDNSDIVQREIAMLMIKGLAVNYEDLTKELEKLKVKADSDRLAMDAHLKFEMDGKAIKIYMLNGDIAGVTKRLKKYKKHMAEYLELYDDLEDHSLTDIISDDKYLKDGEGYRVQCERIQSGYNSLTQPEVLELISTPEWKVFRKPN